MLIDNRGNDMRPLYEGLDDGGFPCIRESRVIDELPTPEIRLAACTEATTTIATLIDKEPSRKISFGSRVYEAFMTKPEAVKHEHSDLLMRRGCEVSLDYCPTYN